VGLDYVVWINDVEKFVKQEGICGFDSDLHTAHAFSAVGSRFEGCRNDLLGRLISLSDDISLSTSEEELSCNDSIKVFIAHGHDEYMVLKVKDFLTNKLGYEAKTLDMYPDDGLTILDKFISVSKDFNKAIILYSPDDIMESGDKRARQNVLFEHGYLLKAYGRKNVIAVLSEGVEWPSDLQGLLYVDFNGEWKESIRKNWGSYKD